MLVKRVFRAAVCLLLLPATLSVLNGTALGHSSEPPPSTQKSAEEDQSNQLPKIETEVTVTATRTETPIRTVGQSVTVISAAELEIRGVNTVADALASVPGFSIARTGAEGGVTSIFVRGGESDFNLVMIDGIQINQPGGAVDLADLGISNVERIEVVRGPSSVLYGADAVSSTINIITKKGTNARPAGSFAFQGGSFGTLESRGSIYGGSDRVHYSLAGLYSKSDGFYDFNNQYGRGEGSARFSFALSDSSALSASTRFNEAEYEFPTDFTGAIVDPNDFRNTTQYVHSLAYQNQISERYGTRIQYGYHLRTFEDFTVFDGVSDFYDSTFTAEESRHYLDWQNNIRLSSSNAFTAGLSFERESSLSESLDRRSVGLYAQNQFSWQDRFFLTAGVRLDANNRFEDFLTGSVSLAFLPNANWKLRASLGNGFRAPAFAEIRGFPEFGIIGNPALKPEKNVALDFGLDFLKGPLQLSGTVFFNRYSDLIEFTFLGTPGDPNYQNLEAARAQGLELEAAVPLGSLFRLGGNYTLLDTEVTDTGLTAGDNFIEGQELLRRPRHSGLVFLQFVRQHFSMRADFRYKGQRDDVQFLGDFSSSRIQLPGYFVADLSLRLPILPLQNDRGEVSLILKGRNLFNRDYTEIAGFQSPGRSLLAGLEIGFR